MNITIITPCCSLPPESHFNRFWYLVELLSQSHDMLLITSNFKHHDRSLGRPRGTETASKSRLRIMLLEEGDYGKSVSLDRVKNHHVFVKNFEQWLNNCHPDERDVVFSTYPLVATNPLLGKHKACLGHRLIIDVQDVRLKSLSSVASFLKKILHNLLPFSSRTDRAYRYADTLVAVPQTYLDRAKETNSNVPNGVVYIGTDFPRLDTAPTEDFSDDETRFFYLGTFSYSYNVETVRRGIHKLLDDSEDVELHIMGGNLDLDRLKQYICEGVKFYGHIPYAETMSAVKGCDTSINAIHSYAVQSVTNKLSGYMALRKPTLGGQVNDEVTKVLTLLPHVDYRSGDVDSFIQAARDILARRSDPVQSDEIVRHFRRDAAYQKVVNLAERLTRE